MSAKKSEKRQRNHRKTFRMNEKELTAFLENCQAANLSDADYIRVRCCDQKPIRKRRVRPLNEKALAAGLGQLGRVANNVNQIARALNVLKRKSDRLREAEQWAAQDEVLNNIYAVVCESRDLIRQA
ncbi:MAG: plasmid mobilization relaxosome protein MobC, partial [Bacteroidota bacterium]